MEMAMNGLDKQSKLPETPRLLGFWVRCVRSSQFASIVGHRADRFRNGRGCRNGNARWLHAQLSEYRSSGDVFAVEARNTGFTGACAKQVGSGIQRLPVLEESQGVAGLRRSVGTLRCSGAGRKHSGLNYRKMEAD